MRYVATAFLLACIEMTITENHSEAKEVSVPAKQRWVEAAYAFERGEFARAHRLMRETLALGANHVIWLNLSACSVKLEQLDRALEELTTFFASESDTRDVEGEAHFTALRLGAQIAAQLRARDAAVTVEARRARTDYDAAMRRRNHEQALYLAGAMFTATGDFAALYLRAKAAAALGLWTEARHSIRAYRHGTIDLSNWMDARTLSAEVDRRLSER